MKIEDIENMYVGKKYSTFKNDLSEIIIDVLTPIKSQYNDLINNNFIFFYFEST